jgi:hypothetical protein
MCCCKHHHVQYYLLHLQLADNMTNNVVATAVYPIYVKQWRKSSQKRAGCCVFFSEGSGAASFG